MSDDLATKLAAANARIAHGDAERTAGADDRARLLATEADRRGRGGIRAIAQELDLSDQAVSSAVARGRRLSSSHPGRTLPADTLARGLAAERTELTPLSARHWHQLAHLVRGILFDEIWLDSQPGPMLAEEITDTDELDDNDRATLADAARRWTRFQTLAVIDACQRNETDTLPTTSQGSQ